jgi:hypothetical protein
MVAAWESDDEFDYRFVICLALLMRVGTTIEDEVQGNKQRDFPAWWKQAVDGQPFFAYLRGVRNDELKIAERRTAAQRFPSRTMPRMSTGLRARPRSRLTGPGQHVIQSGIIQEAVSRSVSQVLIGPRTIRIFVRGELEGQDALPIVSQYFAWLEQTLLPGAEARTELNASRT